MLLACGAVAGPLFIVVGLTQALTRAGFDPVKHPLSLLSVGDLGWIQITNFVVTGLLFRRLRRRDAAGPASRPGRRPGVRG